MTSFEEYVEQYGFHFNKKLYEFAVSLMIDRKGSRLEAAPKEHVSEWLKAYGIKLNKDVGHDAAYVKSMAIADYYGSSLQNDNQLALYIKDYIDDNDGSDTKAFDHFVVDCRAKNIPIFWDEML